MTNRQEKRKVIKMFNNHFNRIYSTCNQLAKQWDMNSLPIDTFNTVLDKAIVKDIGDLEEGLRPFFNQVNDIVESMKDVAKEHTKAYKVNNVPMKLIKEMRDKVQSSFKDSYYKND